MQKILSSTRAAIDHYGMIETDDRIAVGVSGGKDSVALLYCLAQLRRFYPKKFDIHAIILDPQFNNKPYDYSEIEKLCLELKVDITIKRTHFWEIIFNIRKESNPCSLCARMRRGLLHDTAKELSCNKVALGHHLDDATETFYMNLFEGGNIGCFQPISYLSRKDLHLIRPLIFTREKAISDAVKRVGLPIIKSKCPVDGDTRREKTKQLLTSLEAHCPDIHTKTIGALQRGNISNW
ncbi:MAG: tRNA 2-thiocytidine biosynthesis TtcA family protein [bacterium]|nr:tRNA 2-thiocytidine biosynthesis TtcA family protein [bacterium]